MTGTFISAIRIRQTSKRQAIRHEQRLTKTAKIRNLFLYNARSWVTIMKIQPRHLHGSRMGQIRCDFVLTNFYRDKRVSVRALVDTGATEIIVTPQVARDLGFDLEEVSRSIVTLADGRRVAVPRLRGVEIYFADRSFLSEAVVLDGGECLVGVIPLEGMDLIVDPKRERLIPNPDHPDGPCWRV